MQLLASLSPGAGPQTPLLQRVESPELHFQRAPAGGKSRDGRGRERSRQPVEGLRTCREVGMQPPNPSLRREKESCISSGMCMCVCLGEPRSLQTLQPPAFGAPALTSGRSHDFPGSPSRSQSGFHFSPRSPSGERREREKRRNSRIPVPHRRPAQRRDAAGCAPKEETRRRRSRARAPPC